MLPPRPTTGTNGPGVAPAPLDHDDDFEGPGGEQVRRVVEGALRVRAEDAEADERFADQPGECGEPIL